MMQKFGLMVTGNELIGDEIFHEKLRKKFNFYNLR